MDARATAKEIEAVKVLRAQISDLAEGDEDFIRDTLEGEVDFAEIIDRLLFSIGEDEAACSGIKEHADALAARKSRIEARIEFKRGLILSALEIADKQSMECAAATVSIRSVPSKALIQEESEIPSEYWEPQAPKLNKKSLLSALKENKIIPGATLSNGGKTISIKVR